ncbi:MAG: amino acid permease [Sediminibacterium sp.]|nr:amino acid permease [Sediminibacterium sp.]
MQIEQKKIGVWTSTSLVVGNMIGAGVFLMPSALASFGSISLIGWVFSALGAIVIAKVFASLSKLVPSSDGGPYAFSKAGLGDFAGFLVGWGYLISVWTTNAAIAVSLVSALSTFFPILGQNAILSLSVGLAFLWLLTWVNTLGVFASGRVQLITTILKIVPLALVAIGGLIFLDLKNLLPFNMSGTSSWQAITATTTLTFFAFLGIECATIPASSVENPGENISKATMRGVWIAAGIYLLSTAAVMGMIPAEALKISITPFADAAEKIYGHGAKYWVSAGAAIAAFGALNGFILVQGQMPFAMAKDKLFPAFFVQQNKKGVPVNGVVVSSLIITALMFMNQSKNLASQFKLLILLSTFFTLLPYLFTTVSYLIIRAKNATAFSKSKTFAAVLVSLAAFVFSMWMIIGAGQEIVYWGFIMLMMGVPFYVYMVYKK